MIFWESISQGVLLFGSWKVCLFILIVIAIDLFLVRKSMQSDSPLGLVGLPLRCLVMSLGVAVLMPILIGNERATVGQVFISHSLAILVTPLVLFIGLLLITMIPRLGDFLVDRGGGFTHFIEGIVPFWIISRGVIRSLFPETYYFNNVYPGAFPIAGYMLIAGISSFALGRVAIKVVALSLQKSVFLSDNKGRRIFDLVGSMINALSWLAIKVVALLPQRSVFLSNEQIQRIFNPVGSVINVSCGVLVLCMFASYVRLSLEQIVSY